MGNTKVFTILFNRNKMLMLKRNIYCCITQEILDTIIDVYFNNKRFGMTWWVNISLLYPYLINNENKMITKLAFKLKWIQL